MYQPEKGLKTQHLEKKHMGVGMCVNMCNAAYTKKNVDRNSQRPRN